MGFNLKNDFGVGCLSSPKCRSDIEGEVGNQDLHLPVILPKIPGRFYFLFGKPIETEGIYMYFSLLIGFLY